MAYGNVARDGVFEGPFSGHPRKTARGSRSTMELGGEPGALSLFLR